jgi:DNA-binding SARP family transcriptional activator/tetratricopeptide (TPR) repeat protein
MRRYFRLQTLGRLTLTVVNGETESLAGIRPRHLAVLTVLALSAKPISRDALVEMFWGGEDETRARHSLSNALSGLRGALGADALTSRRDHIALAEDARVEVDTAQFTAAFEAGDDARAVALYGGRFLDAVHVPDAPEFDDWASRERAKLERRFVEACERYVARLERGEQPEVALAVAERWLDAAPGSSSAAAAIARLKTQRLTAKAPTSAPVSPRVGQSSPISAAELTTPLEAAPAAPPSHSVARRRRPWVMAALAASIVVALLWQFRRASNEASAATHPIVAVTSIEDVRGDTSVEWLRVALPRMIATDLDGLRGVESVAPARVRDVVARLAGSGSARLSEQQSMDVARRLRAGWSVSGGLSVAPNGYVLDLTVRNVADVSQSEAFTILASNPVELGRQAAARVATILAAGPGGAARYSGIETSNADAYRHFTRGMMAASSEKLAEAAGQLDSAIAEDSGFVEAIRARRSVAAGLGDVNGVHHLAVLAVRHQDRLPELERLADEIRNVDSLGESTRADALSGELVARFPHDPRAYSTRADLLTSHGRWADAEAVLSRELALDSLAMVAGDGPCTPCEVLWRLSQVRLAKGDRVGAEASARRWVALQPDLPAAWRNLSATLAAVGKSAEAAEAGYHDVALSRNALAAVDFARTMLSARRYDIVDSLLRAWRHTSDPVLLDGTRDIGVMLDRERGRIAGSVAALADLPEGNGLVLVRADGLARLGRLSEARAIFERVGHPPGSSPPAFTAPEARGFSWSHALEADALVRAGDTTLARSLVDSIARSGAQSYYGRDKVLHHHVRGVLFLAQGRFKDAERELVAAEWAANAWTRTNVELARARLALGRPDSAIAALRDAYMAPVDAMARYVPRTELDWWMSRAFAAAHQPDSAAVYAAYVREAWRTADPTLRARLDSLPGASRAHSR